MKNIFKGLGLGFIALALVLTVGVGSAGATLTLGTTSINTAAGDVFALAASNTTGTITIGVANTGGILLGSGSTDKTITIGSTTGVSAVNILGGTGGVNLTGGTNGVVITGVLHATSPVFVTPTLGAALATSINGNIFTTGSSTYTGTAAQTYTFPTTSATIARTDAANTFTGVQTMTAPVISGHATIEGVTPTGATGTGKMVFDGTPTLVTPVLGAATGTSLSVTGTITPTSGASGAAALTNIIKQTYVIDFGAFAGGGASQSQAEAMTGVAFGDACAVGVSADASAEFATAGATVTSAGNIVVVLTPLTAAGTVNPASHTYTVTCVR